MKKSILPVIYSIFALALLFYSSYRSMNLSFTHDESNSYIHGAHYSFMEIVSNNIPLTSTNNHMLNTLCMKYFESMFGSSVFVLRLQSIIAHIIFLVFSFLILKDLKSHLIAVCGLVLLNLNPYLFDFFSLARGYALAFSLMLVSIYYLIAFIKNDYKKHLWICLIFASLSVLANFALLNYFVALLILIQFVFLKQFSSFDSSRKQFFFKKNKPIFITIVVLTVISFEPIRKFIKFKSLFFGGSKGFWGDTVGSLVQKYMYAQQYTFDVALFIKTIILIFTLVYLMILIYKLIIKKASLQNHIGLTLFLLLCLMVIASVAQNILLGTPYVMERFALFYFPVFMLSFIYFFDFLFQQTKLVKISSAVFIVICSVFYAYHFSSTINVTYCDDWKYDAETKNMLEDLEKRVAEKQNEKINLGVSWYFEPAISFYRETKKLNWLNEVKREGLIEAYDYYYVGPELIDTLKQSNKPIIKKYSLSKGTLFGN